MTIANEQTRTEALVKYAGGQFAADVHAFLQEAD
jgi:hypothetical protein